MAEVFERSSALLDTLSQVDVYQAPNADDRDRSITLSCLAANVDTSGAVNVSLFVTNAANQVIAITASEIPVPARATLELLPSRLVLKRGDKIRAAASLINRASLTVSVLEITPDVS
jgi:hypothetical protein